MSSEQRNARLDDVLAELRRQEWRVERSARNGQAYQCFPPDRAKSMVSVSATLADKSANGMVQVLRHLRHQGFVWPPPQRERTHVDPIVRAVPFEPKPSPVVSTENGHARESVDTSSELAFVELKEAKEYADLAAGELRASQAAVEEAQKRLESATGAYKEALSELRAKKAAFDAQFTAEDP